MDRAWTGAFFLWSAAALQNAQAATFTRTFTGLAQVARAVKPAEFTGQGWRTSRSKVLDNAIIGYYMLNETSAESTIPALAARRASPTYITLRGWFRLASWRAVSPDLRGRVGLLKDHRRRWLEATGSRFPAPAPRRSGQPLEALSYKVTLEPAA